MKRYLALALALGIVFLGVPTTSFAAGQQPVPSQDGKVTGTARHSSGTLVTNHGIRLRDAGTGQVAGTSKTDGSGAFSFTNVPKGTFVVELLDDAGQVVATSTAVTIGTGANMTVTGVIVTLADSAAAGAAAAGAAAAGGSFFTSTAGILLLTGLAAGGTIAIVAVSKNDAPKSPSK